MARQNISVYAALGANIAIAATKFIVAAVSHSSAMGAEAVHSLVDSVNEGLLLYGIYSSNKERDTKHPFGYGRDLYFWSFIVSVLIFNFGAGVAFVQGYIHLRNPAVPENLSWIYIVLAISFLFEGTSFFIALKKFKKQTDLPLWAAFRRSKDPTDFTVLFEDAAAILGLLIVFILLFIGHLTRNPYLDGCASIAVGIILTIASVLLARETRSLLIGEGISAETLQRITGIIQDHPAGITLQRSFSLYQSPDEVLLILILQFPPEMKAEKLTDTIESLRKKIKEMFPRISYVVIQPE
jgi:cation diffusion facilitator family transporter